MANTTRGSFIIRLWQLKHRQKHTRKNNSVSFWFEPFSKPIFQCRVIIGQLSIIVYFSMKQKKREKEAEKGGYKLCDTKIEPNFDHSSPWTNNPKFQSTTSQPL